MKSDKTITGVIDQLKEIIGHVQTEICDDYCKFPYQHLNEEEMESVCNGCPLNKLD